MIIFKIITYAVLTFKAARFSHFQNNGYSGLGVEVGRNSSRSEEVKPITYESILIHPSFTFSQEVDVLQINDGNLNLANNCSSVGKESACNVGDLGSIPGSGRSPGEGNATHSNILAWEILWTEEAGGLQSIDWVTRAGHELVTKPMFMCIYVLFSEDSPLLY